MSTILLSNAGKAIGNLLLPGLGGFIGQALGAIAGSVIDSAIVNALTPKQRQEGPRLLTTDIQASTEGSPIHSVFGRARVPGAIVWATRYEEISTTSGGGKGGSAAPVTTEFAYLANFAIAICEGIVGAQADGASAIRFPERIDGVGRIWAYGKEIDRSKYTIRVYPGDDDQELDPLIEAKEGAGNAPAYRGVAYAVFERFPIEEWGNRIPQFTFEVFRVVGNIEGNISHVTAGSSDVFALPDVFAPEDIFAAGDETTVTGSGVEGIALTGAGEFGLDPEPVMRETGDGDVAENVHTLVAATDFMASLDAWERLGRHSGFSVMLVIPWFGDDLRAGSCTVRPKVDDADKDTSPYSWRVSGLTRGGALVVSLIDDVPSFRGTPSDISVIRAIRELLSRVQRVTLCPVMTMDIPAENTLPNPYSADAATEGQPVYPWRGRITCSPAPGFSGTVDKTGTAATQVATFMGTCAPGDFGNSGDTITYSGPDEWSYRRMVLHYARLMAVAKAGASVLGRNAMLIGSELRGLEQVRSSATAYPFVDALIALAADCRTILGDEVHLITEVDVGTKLGYAADWTSWNNHRPDDGSGDVLFNLDPLWADANIQFIGIDAYFPLADWRDGSDHLDFDPAGPISILDQDYLRGNVAGGEHFDWTYADQAARDAQERTPIADADPADEPWVFRQKDIKNWWLNEHHDRPGGVRSGGATDWTAKSKPIRFTEYGCPAVDKGANQPNVFHDGKSSESAFPYYSSGARDDAAQRAWIEALIAHYSDFGFGDGFGNPYSSLYSFWMVDTGFSHAWAWDARPWPSFPQDSTTWADAAAWETGHWLSGRFGTAPAQESIRAILESVGFADYAIEALPGVVDGVTVGSVTSPRAILESVQSPFGFDAVESDGKIRFISRHGRPAVATLTVDDLAVDGEEASDRFRITRGQETELPGALKIHYGDPSRDDQPAEAEARRSTGQSLRVVEASPPVVMAENLARAVAETELHAAWVGREKAAFSLPPSFLRLDPGDVIRADFGAVSRRLKIAGVTDGEARRMEGMVVAAASYAPAPIARSGGRVTTTPPSVAAQAILVDGPLIRDDDGDHAGYIGGVRAPFGSGLTAWRSPTTSGYVLDTALTQAAIVGVTTADFYSGPAWRWDRVNSLYLDLVRGTVASAEELQVLNGANVLLVENGDGEWELLQFATATPNGARSYILTDLLRGQRGSEHAMRDPVAAGARLMIFDAAVKQTALPPAMVGLELNWKVGPADEDIGSESFIAFVQTMTAKGRRPLSPAHLRGVRDIGTDDWALSWVRRTRIGGDNWDPPDVPLGEDSEAWRLDIFDGEDVVRTVDLTAATFAYTAAMQTADFGAPQLSFDIRVAQLSALYGAGTPERDLIWDFERAAA